MAKLRCGISISVDGFVAGPNPSEEDPLGEGGEQLHEWALKLAAWREPHGLEGGEVNASTEVIAESLANVGATVMGRNMFGGGSGPWGADPWEGWWGDDPPFHTPVFVLTHHARGPLEKQGGTTFTFVTDGIESALEQAKAAAGGKDVWLGGGANVIQQYLAAGLVDELEINIAPVVLGSGTRLFDNLARGTSASRPSGSSGPPTPRTGNTASPADTCEHMFVSGEATILHADLDAFYASVEQRDDPRLRGRPVIVGAGVVLAASYEAKAHGIHSAMGGAQARRLCPHAIVVPPRMSAYSEASKAVYRVFDDTTPLVEGLSIDEAFLDVRGMQRLAGTPAEIAARLKRTVLERVGLPITVGVARTKFLAKVASGVAKPNGLLVVPPDRELAFLHPLEIERLWGVGPVTANKLRLRGITTVGQVARLREWELVSLLGRASGRHLHALAHNRDPRPVQVGRRRGSIGSQCALGRSRKNVDAVDAVLISLVDRVTRRMRAAHRVGRTVVLRLRFDDFTRATRSHTLPYSTAHTQTILDTARGLLATAMPLIERQGLTLVGVAVANLANDLPSQLVLPFEPHRGGALDAALDEVRARFGPTAITRAVLLGREVGMTVPLLPD
jgi:DNA polymerase-4